MKDKAYAYMNWPRIEGLIYGEESAPKDLLQPQITKNGVLLQCYRPDADQVAVISGGKTYPMIKEDEAGYFAVMLPGKKIPEYQLEITEKEIAGKETASANKTVAENAKVILIKDPYAFPNQITEKEEKVFLAGIFYDAYTRLGAHELTVNGTSGTLFAVWAPNAQSVSLVGDFNSWTPFALPMQRLPKSGLYELFVPGLSVGALYKYAVKQKDGAVVLKTDPYGQAVQAAPEDASIIPASSIYEWDDDAWMQERWQYAGRRKPMAIYETSITDWKSSADLIFYVKNEKFTHVELHPVMEYLEEESDGYSTTSYYSVTSRLGTAEDLKRMIDELHQAGIGVFLDWTPAHFPQGESGLKQFDGTALYENPEERMAYHPMWNTMLYNFASPMVSDFLISNAFYWAEEFHVDGLRLDDVDAMLYLDYGRRPSEYTPNIYGGSENLHAVEFLKHLTSIMHKRFPGFLLLAQEDGLWPALTEDVENDCIGMDYKWSGGWTKDLLDYLGDTSKNRSRKQDQLTASMLYTYCEHYILTLGSRDVGSLAAFRDRISGKNHKEKRAQIRAAYAYLYFHPGCKMIAPDPKLTETLAAYIGDLNTFYTTHPALFELDDTADGFEWISQMNSEKNVLSFLRKGEEETLMIVCNFSEEEQKNFEIGVPYPGSYKEIFNSDEENYGGTGLRNPRAKVSRKARKDGRENSVKLNLPSYSVLVFACKERK